MKRVLVTGAGGGIGSAVVRRLLQDGFEVCASGRTETDELLSLGARYPNSYSFHMLDLAEIDRIAPFVRELTRTDGFLYGLVNNAGLGTEGVLATMHNTQIEEVMRVNAVAPIILTKYVSRGMMANRQGRIINISSIIASTGFTGLAAYAASKAALEGFTRSLARELGKLNITVNAVAPGFVQTKMTDGLAGDKLGSIQRRSPLGCLATPEDVAGAVSYIIGDDARSITGTVLTVDAGSTA
ncbi:SDR family NAD(P)-dependent oxidoreductase [Sphingomonas sp. R86520]|uniref:SDR family NAD(P)-dependent oxidoreductase n=1 Tax=Sphingomonas sp. R86520 TaxID=3093859 RepID=UPI0036D26F63